MRQLTVARAGLALGLHDKHGQPLHVGDRVRVQYWHGFTFEGTVTYRPAWAAYAIDQDLIAEMDLWKGTTLEVLQQRT